MSLLRWILLLLLLLLAVPVAAQQIYVKNRPFEGKVVKDSDNLWLELGPLQQALGFQAQLETEGARIDGKLVRILKQGEVVLVPLTQVASVVGAVVRENPEFGTIDVYLAVRTSALGAGLDIETSPSGNSADSGQKVQTAGYSFILPEGMQVSRDPRVIKAYLEKGNSTATPYSFDALVSYKGDTKYKRGAAIFSWFTREIPKGMELESTLLAYQFEIAATLLHQLHVALVKDPEVVETAGQRFVLGAGVSKVPPHDGMMVLLRVDAKKKRFYQVIVDRIAQSEDKPTADFLRLLTTVTTR